VLDKFTPKYYYSKQNKRKFITMQQAKSLKNIEKKGAVFGLDARIAMAIYVALALIVGSILLKTIKNIETTAIYTDLQEISKANKEYYLNTGKILESLGDSSPEEKSTRKIVSLAEASPTGSAYINYKVDSNALSHSKYGKIRLYSLTDKNWDNISNADSWCSESQNCYMWISLDELEPKQLENIDKKYDVGNGSATGNVRYRVLDKKLYVKDMAIAHRTGGVNLEVGIWQLYEKKRELLYECYDGERQRAMRVFCDYKCSKDICPAPQPSAFTIGVDCAVPYGRERQCK
jgi:hypothetical protein